MGALKLNPDLDEKIDPSNDREQGLSDNFKDPGMDEFMPDFSLDSEAPELSLMSETALAVQELVLELNPDAEQLAGQGSENTSIMLAEPCLIEDPIETGLDMAAEVNNFNFVHDDMEASLLGARADMAESMFDLVACERKFNDLVEEILLTIARAVGAEAGSVLEVDTSLNEFFFRASVGGHNPSQIKSFRVPMDKGIVGFVARTGEPLLIRNTEDDDKQLLAIAMTNGLNPKSCVAAPIYVSGQLYGVIELFNKVPGEFFTEQDLAMFVRGVAMAAKALEVRFLMAELGRRAG